MEQEPLLYLTDENGNVRPYTREELIARVEEGRKQIAMGNYHTNEEVFRKLSEEFGLNIAEYEHQLAEAV